jgi:hypothetical protein
MSPRTPAPTRSSPRSKGSVIARALKFEKVLRYADFPDLNCHFPGSHNDYRVDYDEVRQVLKWLHGKGVEEIVKVKVPDRLFSPHEDEAVEYCVKTFRVSNLN